MKRLVPVLSCAVLAASACARPVLQTAPADARWTLVEASDWRARAPELVGKRVELHGNLSTLGVVDPRSSFSNTGRMRGPNRRQVLATVLFDQISSDQVTWMARNNCLLTCVGVFVRGIVEIVGPGPVLDMIDISCTSRAGGANALHPACRDAAWGDRTAIRVLPSWSRASLVHHDSAVALAEARHDSADALAEAQYDSAGAVAVPAPSAEAAPMARTDTAAAADTGWTPVPASDWRTRAPGLIGRRVELAGDLSLDPTTFLQFMSGGRSGRAEMIGHVRRQLLAIVLFDQLSEAQMTWMRENRCLPECAGVFVRGVVVLVGAGPALRMIDVSSETRAGGGAATRMQRDSTDARPAPAPNAQGAPPVGTPHQGAAIGQSRAD